MLKPSDLPDVPYPGQWRLARVDMANWGTFSGYQSLPVDRRGLLLTGASGSGKSTILDAVSTVLTPPSHLHLNAAANSGNQRDKERSISNYVRGVWGRRSGAAGELAHAYLRPKQATWSGVMLRYEDGFPYGELEGSERRRHEPVNLLGIFFQKSNTVGREGLKKFYAVVRGDCALHDFAAYGMNEADMSKFNKDFKETGRAWRDHASFEAHLCGVLRISSPKTLILLHKTQAAKDIGSLDDLFRKYMLDTPRTLELADAAVEQFQELSQAHEGVVDQRRQMECLEPLLVHDETHAQALAAEVEARGLLDALNPFADETAVELLEQQLEKRARRADALVQDVASAKAEQSFAKQAHDSAMALLSKRGGVALDTAHMQVDERNRQLLYVQKNRDSLKQDLATWDGVALPATREEFEALKRQLSAKAQEARSWLDGNEDEKVSRFGRVGELRERRTDISEELRHLRRQRSNIPSKLHAIRTSIAHQLGLSLADLPFVGELIDVNPNEAAWQPAIERLLGGRARTMLVERRHAEAINEFLETRHLGERFEYDAVPDRVSVPGVALHEKSLVRKVTVANVPNHESFALWVNKLLRERFNYVCVDTPADMERHPKALTRGGQTKSGEHHVKDDRRNIADRSRWVLGSTNDQKVERFEGDLAECERLLTAARADTNDITAKELRLQAICRLDESLRSKPWDDYDEAQAKGECERAEAFYRELEQSDEFREAEALRAKAEARLEAANEAVQKALVAQQANEEKLKDIEDQIHDLEQRAKRGRDEGSPLSAETKGQLTKLFEETEQGFRSSVSSVYQTANRVQRALDERAGKAVRAQQNARRKAELVLQQYKMKWPAQAADLSGRFEDRIAYLDRYRQIKASGLPEYEHKFLEVLNSFSQDQITVIASEIRNAFREVRERLEPVNRSLLLSEYRSGVHLQIEVKENRGPRVDEFLADLKEITKGSWSEDDLASAERRYERTAAVMKRLGSSETADRTWRMACLNTPDHMKFIAREVTEDGSELKAHDSDGGLSGGQRQKLVFFCLAAALRYQLADEDQPIPSYGTIILDEAFNNSDRFFAEDALAIFGAFGFHMVLATPGKLLQTAEDHIGSIVVVTCEDEKRSRLSPVVFENDALAAEGRESR